MIKTLHFEFGEIRIFPNYVVVVMKEGINVIPEYNEELVAISEEYYKGRPFGYITYRRNSYSVDPMIYLKTSEIKNLSAFAVVCKDELNKGNLEMEKMFLRKPFKQFGDLDDAKNWVKEIIQENNQ